MCGIVIPHRKRDAIVGWRVGEPQAVDEVWQEIACHAIGRVALPVPVNVAAWLYRTAVRQALLFRRKAVIWRWRLSMTNMIFTQSESYL